MSLKLYTEKVKNAGLQNQATHGHRINNPVLKVGAGLKMKVLVSSVVEYQIANGALDHLSNRDLQLLVHRIDDLQPVDFKLVEAIVEALIPTPTGKSINLEDEGINVPGADAK